MTHKTLIKISLLLVLMLTGPLSAAYAQKGAAMKGMVRDEFGKPLVGVAIRSANGNNRSVTQKDGSYSIDVNDGSDRVVFSYLGYADQSVPYRKGADVDVKMLADGHYGDQTIHMGYTDQKLKDVSGAVSVVTGDELRKSPVASLSQALTGRLTGLYLDEYQSEPTREKLYAIGRGLHTQNYNTTPLVVIDGIPCSYNANESYQYINANEIETVTFLKDASTAALYGIQGANGVLVITTKRGQPGRTKIEASFDQSFQQWITHPRIYSSWEYATMRRQAAINDGLSGDQLPFTEEQIAREPRAVPRQRLVPHVHEKTFVAAARQCQRIGRKRQRPLLLERQLPASGQLVQDRERGIQVQPELHVVQLPHERGRQAEQVPERLCQSERQHPPRADAR